MVLETVIGSESSLTMWYGNRALFGIQQRLAIFYTRFVKLS